MFTGTCFAEPTLVRAAVPDCPCSVHHKLLPLQPLLGCGGTVPCGQGGWVSVLVRNSLAMTGRHPTLNSEPNQTKQNDNETNKQASEFSA